MFELSYRISLDNLETLIDTITAFFLNRYMTFKIALRIFNSLIVAFFTNLSKVSVDTLIVCGTV